MGLSEKVLRTPMTKLLYLLNVLFVSFSVWEAACLVFSAWLVEVVR